MRSIIKKKKNILLGILFIAIVVCTPFLFGEEGCDDGLNEVANSVDQNIQNEDDNNSQVGLGKKLQNPFSVVNMKRAFDSLKVSMQGQNDRLANKDNLVRTTHLYVKFSPRNIEQLDKLKDDTTIHISVYPLDHEKTANWLAYKDPNVPAGQPTYRYSAVPVDYVFNPQIEYTILEELYLPEKDPTLNGNSANGRTTEENEIFIGTLIQQAMANTDNLTPTEKEARKNSRLLWGSSFRPRGRISKYNEAGTIIGAPNVHVKASSWFSTNDAYTVGNGDFSLGVFYSSITYYIQWDTYHFELEDGNTDNTAVLYGPSGRNDRWDYIIPNNNNIQKYNAEIYDAAYNFYYGNRDGIHAAENGPWSIKVDIQVHATSNGGVNGNCEPHIWSTNPTLNIWTAQNTSDPRSLRGVYSTTIHELAHAGHWDRVGHQDFSNTHTSVHESWARGVQWYLTKRKYPDIVMDYEDSKSGRTGPYSGVVQDLMDNAWDDYLITSNIPEVRDLCNWPWVHHR